MSATVHDSCPPDGTRKRAFLRLCFTLCVLLAYVRAEWGLRQNVYGQPRFESTADWKPIVDRLPILLREPIERRLKANDLENRISATSKNPKQRLKLLYELAPLYDGEKRLTVWRRIVRGFPDDPGAARAWGELLHRFPDEISTRRFIDYATRLTTADGAEKAQVWATGWAAMRERSGADRKAFLVAMAEAGPIGAALKEPYEELAGLAARDGDSELAALASKVLEPSKALWLRQQEEMPR